MEAEGSFGRRMRRSREPCAGSVQTLQQAKRTMSGPPSEQKTREGTLVAEYYAYSTVGITSSLLHWGLRQCEVWHRWVVHERSGES